MGKAHSAALATMQMYAWPPPSYPRLVCVADVDPGRAQEGATRFGFEHWTTNWREVVDRDDVDVVDICAPPLDHCEIATAAAEKGKHVMCEKPLGMNADEARSMCKAVERAGVRHIVTHTYRRTPAVVYARQLIDDHTIGRIYTFRGFYLQDWCADPRVPHTWRHSAAVSGSGSLGDIGSHLIDIARYLVGEITDVTAMTATRVFQRPSVSGGEMLPVDVDDEVLFLARFGSDVLGRFEASRFAYGRKNLLGFEINGEGGSIYFDYEHMTKLQLYLADDPPSQQGFRVIDTGPQHPYGPMLWPIPSFVIGWVETKILEYADFFKAITDETDISPSFYDGYRENQLIDAVIASARTQSWVSTDLDTSL